MNNKKESIMYTFRIDSDSLRNLKRIADGRSITYMINTAIKEYLSKFESSSSDKWNYFSSKLLCPLRY